MNPLFAQAIAVAAGGATGALLRFGANLACVRGGIGGLPAATLIVNVIGCLFAGLLLVWIEQRADPAFWRALLITGVLGALTTFSALGLELWQLLRAERWLLAGATLAAHVGLGVAAVALGWRLGKALWPGRLP
ncbi:fluoride efflux transporter FluC [Luteimonas abyssi]|jgi:fluoride exporter|uniref:fluoride efflux transporter FluC n=1 Tax=Luteimonas abyssi TaxID=1247514 RepID=UPI0009E6B2BA|nr:CrcB family protein [Luteimonas abyssi]